MSMNLDGTVLQVEVVSSGTTYSLDTLLKRMDYTLERNNPERATIDVIRNADTVNFDPMDIIQVDINVSGEVTFTTRFYGYVEEVRMDSDSDVVSLVCAGESKKLQLSYIGHAEYGQNYVDRGRYNISMDLDVNNNAYLIFAQLSNDAGYDPILPLENVWAMQPLGADGTQTELALAAGETFTVVSDWTGSTYKALASPIRNIKRTTSTNPEVLVNLRKRVTGIGNEPSTLTVEIYNANDTGVGPEGILTFGGSVVAQGSLDYVDATTVFGWVNISLTLLNSVTSIGHALAADSDPTGIFYVVFRCAAQTVGGAWDIKVRYGADSVYKAYAWENGGSGLVSTDWTSTINAVGFAAANILYSDDSTWVGLIPGIGYDMDVKNWRVILSRLNQNVAGGMGDWQKGDYTPDKTLFETTPIRVSYWRGKPDFSSTVENFANDWIKPFVDTVDVSLLTPPDMTFQAFIFDNVTIYDALQEIINWSTAVWRIYKNQAGSKIFEVRSSTVRADWTGLAAANQDDRSFYSGLDVTTGTTGDPSFVRLKAISKRRILGNKFGRTLGRGALRGAISSITGVDSGFTNVQNMFGADGIVSSEGADALNAQAVEYVESVDVRAVAVDLSSQKNLYDDVNQLIYIKDSSLGIDAAYVVRAVTTNISTNEGVVFNITCEDVVSTRFGDKDKPKSGGEGIAGLVGGSRAGTGLPGETSPGGFGGTKNTTQPYGVPTNEGEQFVYGEDLTVTHGAANYAYYIALGTGGLSSSDLATEIGYAVCSATTVDTTNVLLTARLGVEDFIRGGATFSADNKIGAASVKVQANSVDTPILVKAWTLGPTGTFTGMQPYVWRKGIITVCIKLQSGA